MAEKTFLEMSAKPGRTPSKDFDVQDEPADLLEEDKHIRRLISNEYDSREDNDKKPISEKYDDHYGNNSDDVPIRKVEKKKKVVAPVKSAVESARRREAARRSKSRKRKRHSRSRSRSRSKRRQ